MLTQEYLKEILHYDKETGIFIWKRNLSTKNKKEAGWIDGNNYRQINLKNKQYYCHRLAWLYEYGYFPENEIDHINKIRNDNRICNLREVSRVCNARNGKLSINNTSGVKGVSFFKRDNNWTAQIMINYKTYKLGYYDDFDDAVCARLAAEQCLNWSGCDKSSPAYLYVKENIKK